MFLLDTVYKCINEFPSLFYYTNHPLYSDFIISKLAVLHHLFLVNGNGYAWVDGYLCDIEDLESSAKYSSDLGWTGQLPKYGSLTYPHNFPPIKKQDELFAYEFGFVKERCGFPFAIYPISSYSLRLPSFVHKDWLIGARDIAQFALFSFQSNALDGWNKEYSETMKKNSIEILNIRLDEINNMIGNINS